MRVRGCGCGRGCDPRGGWGVLTWANGRRLAAGRGDARLERRDAMRRDVSQRNATQSPRDTPCSAHCDISTTGLGTPGPRPCSPRTGRRWAAGRRRLDAAASCFRSDVFSSPSCHSSGDPLGRAPPSPSTPTFSFSRADTSPFLIELGGADDWLALGTAIPLLGQL